MAQWTMGTPSVAKLRHRETPVDRLPTCRAMVRSGTSRTTAKAGMRRGASEGKGPQRRSQQWLGRRLEEVAKAVGGGYCRLQMPLKLALGVRGTAAGHRLGDPEPRQSGAEPPPPPPPLVHGAAASTAKSSADQGTRLGPCVICVISLCTNSRSRVPSTPSVPMSLMSKSSMSSGVSEGYCSWAYDESSSGGQREGCHGGGGGGM